jgi:hypothetical protein
MPHSLSRVISALACCSIAAAADVFVGAEACRGCHPVQFASQSKSHHANSLTSAKEIDRFTYLPSGMTSIGGAKYSFTKTSSGFAVEVAHADTRVKLPIDWIVGANDQGLTFLSRTSSDRFVEHRLSYYRRKGGYDITAGQSGAAAPTPDVAIGAPVSPREASKCLGCHATSLQSTAGGPDYASVVAGVSCERCHGAGAAHVAAMKAGSADRKIQNPGRGSGDDVLAFCGDCHRTEPPPGVALDEPIVTRFQPIGLQMSACFTSSNGALTCTTCHNPHENARRGDDGY